MDSQASKEKRFVSTIEKVVMYVMYAVFGVINGAIIFSGDYEALFVMVPITVFSLGVTKWGMKWQNEYPNWRKNDITRVNGKPYGMG